MYEDTFQIRDSFYHLKKAEEYESSGNFSNQRKELELYQRDGGKDKEPLLKLLELYNEEGKRKNYKKLLKKLLSLYKEDKELKQKLKEFLAEENDLEYFKEFLEEDEIQMAVSGKEAKIVPPSERVILKFLELFSGREGVYARMWHNSDNSISYSPVNQPFNFQVAKNHLLGNYTVGIYPVRIDNTVLFSVFDVDIKKSYLEPALYNKEDFDALRKAALEVANAIKEVLNVYGIVSYIEDSGYKGYHVWIFYDEPISAHYVKGFMQNVLKGVSVKYDSISVEIFPKQSKVKEKRYGSLVKLPGSFHLKTSKRTNFLDAEQSTKGFYDFILKIRKNPKALIEDLIKQLKIEKEKEVESSIDLREFSYIRSKCAVLDYLCDKAERGEPLNRYERNAIIYTIGHLEDGPEIVNYLLKRYIERGDTEPLKKRLKGYPMSCGKIRKTLKHITSEVACNCVFGEEISYPTPLLHIQTTDRKEIESTEAKPFISDFQKNIDRYISLKKKILEMEKELKMIEEYFNKKFNEAGVNILETDIGRFIRVVNPNGTITFHYELK